jgi:hypothetical protein
MNEARLFSCAKLGQSANKASIDLERLLFVALDLVGLVIARAIHQALEILSPQSIGASRIGQVERSAVNTPKL